MRKWLARNNFPIALFDDGGSTGDNKGAGNKPDPKNDPNADGGGNEPDVKKPDQPFAIFPDARSFSSRVDREARKQLDEKAQSLGFKDSQEMEKAVKDIKAKADAEKSETEQLKEKNSLLEQEKLDTVEKTNSRLINSDLKVFAVQAGIIDPEAAALLADRSEITVDDSGAVQGAKEAIDGLVKNKPYLVGKGTKTEVGSASNPGGDGGNPLSDEEQGIELAKARAKKKEVSAGFNPWA